MNKEQTALQQLIARLEVKYEKLKELAFNTVDPVERARIGGKIEGVALAIGDAQQELQTERQQIEEAHTVGYERKPIDNHYKAAADYYNEKYGS
jgi:hypothetical protein